MGMADPAINNNSAGTLKEEASPILSENEQTSAQSSSAVSSAALGDRMNLLGMLDIPLTIEVGRAQMRMRELLELKKGSVIELDKLAGEPVEVYANGKKIANGNIITANGRYCVRINSILEDSK